MLYYVSGNFMSRRGVDEGSITLHAAGAPHGPQPGAVESSLGKTSTDEIAVMIDTFKPLQLAQAGARVRRSGVFSLLDRGADQRLSFVSGGFDAAASRAEADAAGAGLFAPAPERDFVAVLEKSASLAVRKRDGPLAVPRELDRDFLASPAPNR